MISVALIGPDGAGKTTTSRLVERSLPIGARYVYMGANPESSNVLLPTSRLITSIRRASRNRRNRNAASNGKLEPPKHARLRQSAIGRFVAWLRSYLRLVNLLAEECFRHGLVTYYQKRGLVVLLDRWFFADFYAYEATDQKKQPLSKRIHQRMLDKVYPKPDLVIYLDLPATVLYARKGEGTVESLERNRQKYLMLRNVVEHYFVINANQEKEEVVSAVVTLILTFYKAKTSGNLPATMSCTQI